ncbi:MAG: DNA internalization-related competence protein ComEC/Rec2 [Thermoleophilia bacterium]
MNARLPLYYLKKSIRFAGSIAGKGLDRWPSGVRPSTPLAVLLAYVAGVSACLLSHSWWAAGPAALLAAALLGAACRCRRPALLIALAFLAAGFFIGAARLDALGGSELKTAYLGKRVTLEGYVAEAPAQKGNRISFVMNVDRVRRLDAVAADSEDVMVEVRCRDSCAAGLAGGLRIGRRVSVSGDAGEPPANAGTDFDYGLFLERRGINAVLSASADAVRPLADSRGGWRGFVDAARRRATGNLENGGWGTAGAVLKGMVLGDTDQVPDQVISDFRDSGLLHMLAVSGQNVVLLGFILALMCRALRLPPVMSSLFAIAVICVYVPLTGAGPSILRAGVVGILGLAALLFSGQSDRYYFLALAAAVILTLNPYSLLDPGFQLSFGAVLAIFLVAPLMAAALAFLPKMLAEACSISAAAGLVTAPITLVHFQQISILCVPANLFAEPAAGPVMLLGVLSIAAGMVSADLGWLLNAAASACTGYVISVAHFFASLPGAVYSGAAPSWAAIILFYLALALAVGASRTCGFRAAAGWLRRRRRLVLAVVLVLALAAGFACAGGRAGRAPAAYTVSFLDVGQGDAELIQLPGQATILIDGGPGSRVLDRLRENGVGRLDAVILTHPHADHLAGLLEVLKSYPVASVYDGGPQTASPMYRDFLRLVRDRNIPYRALKRGQTLTYGGLALKVWNPGDSQRPDDPNANSVVIVASFRGLDILCPGDAEGDVLGTLGLPPVEVYKIGHHGSSDSELAQVLELVKPAVAVISVGDPNDYGHPAADTLTKLKRVGPEVFRTDHQGTVHVSLTGAGMEITTDR